MKKTLIGAPEHLSVRPLIYGLNKDSRSAVELIYDEPAGLADALSRGLLDAALIPSIEYLRGVGRYAVDGPALVAQRRTRTLVLATGQPLDEIRRIAVGEHCRTPLAVLRIVLDKLHSILPDFCVLKELSSWQDGFDGVLLTGDHGLSGQWIREGEPVKRHDLGQMWYKVFAQPLVLALWAYNDERLKNTIEPLLIRSRDYGVQNLDLLARGLASTSSHDESVLKSLLNTCWGYHLGRAEEEGLRVLEENALRYQLIQEPRSDKVHTAR